MSIIPHLRGFRIVDVPRASVSEDLEPVAMFQADGTSFTDGVAGAVGPAGAAGSGRSFVDDFSTDLSRWENTTGVSIVGGALRVAAADTVYEPMVKASEFSTSGGVIFSSKFTADGVLTSAGAI